MKCKVYHCSKLQQWSFTNFTRPGQIGLLRRNREEREQTDDAELAELAQFSLFLPARVIAYLTAEIRRLDFWKLWKEMRETVYHDEVLKQYAFEEKEWKSRREVPIPPVRTSEFLRQDGHFVFLDTPNTTFKFVSDITTIFIEGD